MTEVHRRYQLPVESPVFMKKQTYEPDMEVCEIPDYVLVDVKRSDEE